MPCFSKPVASLFKAELTSLDISKALQHILYERFVVSHPLACSFPLHSVIVPTNIES